MLTTEAGYVLFEQEAFRRAMKKHPDLVSKDGTPYHDLGAYVYDSELDLVIIDWYINKNKPDDTKPA